MRLAMGWTAPPCKDMVAWVAARIGIDSRRSSTRICTPEQHLLGRPWRITSGRQAAAPCRDHRPAGRSVGLSGCSRTRRPAILQRTAEKRLGGRRHPARLRGRRLLRLPGQAVPRGLLAAVCRDDPGASVVVLLPPWRHPLVAPLERYAVPPPGAGRLAHLTRRRPSRPPGRARHAASKPRVDKPRGPPCRECTG